MKLIHKKFANLVLYKPNYKKINYSEINYKDFENLIFKKPKDKILKKPLENDKLPVKQPKNVSKGELLERKFKFNILLNRYRLDLKEFHCKKSKSLNIKKCSMNNLNKTSYKYSFLNSNQNSLNSTMKSDFNLNNSYGDYMRKTTRISLSNVKQCFFKKCLNQSLPEYNIIKNNLNKKNLTVKGKHFSQIFKERDFYDYHTLIQNFKIKFQKEKKLSKLSNILLNSSSYKSIINKKNIMNKIKSLNKNKKFNNSTS